MEKALQTNKLDPGKQIKDHNLVWERSPTPIAINWAGQSLEWDSVLYNLRGLSPQKADYEKYFIAASKE